MQDKDPTFPISDLRLSTRARNVFANYNIVTLADLLGMAEEDLLKLRGFGKVSLADVRRMMQEENLGELRKSSYDWLGEKIINSFRQATTRSNK